MCVDDYIINLPLFCRHLPKLDTGSGSDPFVECFWSFGKDGETHLFHKTKTIDDAQNAKWEEIISFDSYQTGTNQVKLIAAILTKF